MREWFVARPGFVSVGGKVPGGPRRRGEHEKGAKGGLQNIRQSW